MDEGGKSIHVTLDIGADVGTVWRAWTELDWLCGWMVEHVEGALREGSRTRWRWDSLGVEVDLDVLECASQERLVLAARPAGRAPQTQAVMLTQVAGGTRVELTHGGFAATPAGDAERAGTAAGWHVMLRVLAHYLAGRAGRRRECTAVLAPLAAPLETIGPLLHDPRGRAGWLCGGGPSPALARERERFVLVGPEGAAVSGHVLALAPPFQLALAWDEVDGILILRAIQATRDADGPVLAGAQAWSWSPERPAWRAARAVLESAVGRLALLAGGAPAGSA